MRLGFLVALVAFLVVGSDVLLGQWITGYATGIYMLGTALLLAGMCLGIFAFIAALGLAVAAAFRRPADPHASLGEQGVSAPLDITPEHVAG